MPRHRATDTQVKQINKMFSNPHVIGVVQPCSLHNRKGSIEIYKLGKRNSIDSNFCGADKLHEGVERRAKSFDHTAPVLHKQKLSNRNSIASTSDLFPNYTVILENDSPKSSSDRRRSCFDGIENPSDFPSMLRNFQSSLSVSKNKLNREKSGDSNNNNHHRHSVTPDKLILAGDTENYLRKPKRLSFDVNIDNNTFSTSTTTTTLTNPMTNRKLSSSSADSLEYARSPSRRFSNISIGSNISPPKHTYFDSADFEKEINSSADQNRPKFIAVTTLEDVQAVRCAEFHPNGSIYAVGSNSKTFRICEYPVLSEIRENHTAYQPTVLFKRTKHHKGSIYCMSWSPQGDLIATGSNDKTVKLMRFNEIQKQLEGRETELTMHDGTVRDLCFLEDSINKCSLLISGGAGDCKIYVTDCSTSTPFQALSGHSGHILSLYNWGGVTFASGSQDKTVRFWDLRTRGCVNVVTPITSSNASQGSPVAAVCVDPSGRLLVTGHEDSSCVLYDIRGNRIIQCFKPHTSDIRSIRFSPSAYYLLTAGYDNKMVLTDLQGDLTMPLPSVVVAQHSDKVISGRWHPVDFSFLSTSADKTATLWALPPM